MQYEWPDGHLCTFILKLVKLIDAGSLQNRCPVTAKETLLTSCRAADTFCVFLPLFYVVAKIKLITIFPSELRCRGQRIYRQGINSLHCKVVPFFSHV